MKTLKQKIEVMQAALDGKEIELRNYPYDDDHGWNNRPLECLVWNWPSVDYRTKPEPMELWINIYKRGTMYVHEDRETAESFKESGVKMKTIKVREVIE